MRPVVWEHAGAEIVWDPASLRRLLPSRVHRLVAGAPVDDVVALTLETIATVEATPTRLSAPVAIEVVRLRAALVAASDAEYAAARDAALPFVERADPIRLGCLAGAFTAERAWTERAIRGYLAKGARPARLAELAGPFVTDPRLAEQLAVATAASPAASRRSRTTSSRTSASTRSDRSARCSSAASATAAWTSSPGRSGGSAATTPGASCCPSRPSARCGPAR